MIVSLAGRSHLAIAFHFWERSSSHLVCIDKYLCYLEIEINLTLCFLHHGKLTSIILCPFAFQELRVVTIELWRFYLILCQIVFLCWLVVLNASLPIVCCSSATCSGVCNICGYALDEAGTMLRKFRLRKREITLLLTTIKSSVISINIHNWLSLKKFCNLENYVPHIRTDFCRLSF